MHLIEALAELQERHNRVINTHTSEYCVADTCIAIQLFNGDFIFADKVCPRGNNLLYVPRGCPQKETKGIFEWNLIDSNTIVEITVGICPR